MAESKIQMVNAALVLMGEAPISSLDDDTNDVSIAASTLLDIHLQAMLAETSWQFATVTRDTTFNTGVPDTLGRALFQIPAGTIRLWSVLVNGSAPRAGWKIEGRYIIVDAGASDAVTAEVTIEPSESLWPPHFALSLVYRLAAGFALSLTENEKKAELLDRRAEMILAMARSIDGTQETPRAVHSSRLTAGRRG